MKLLAFAPLATLACVAASPARAADDAVPVVLEPSSQWNVDFGEDKCRLARTFGEEGSRHLLSFEQIGPEARFDFAVAGPLLERFRPPRTEIRFGELHSVARKADFTGTLQSFGPALIYSNLGFAPSHVEQDRTIAPSPGSLPEIDPSLAARVDAVTILVGKRELIFRTENLADAVKVLNQCAQNLMASWGLDLERHLSAASIPVWTNEKAIVRDIAAYPLDALKDGDRAIVRMRIIVDEAGKVAECKLIQATADDGLNSRACKAMQKATFSPALDRNGEPFRSFYLNNIVYSTE